MMGRTAPPNLKDPEPTRRDILEALKAKQLYEAAQLARERWAVAHPYGTHKPAPLKDVTVPSRGFVKLMDMLKRSA